VLNQELESGQRVISADEHYAVLAPYASIFPFETMIIPRRHCHSFVEEPRSSLAALARCLRDLMARMRAVLRDPPYNFTFHTAPNVEAEGRRQDYWYTIKADFHWHIRVMPRLTQPAGFEWGTGMYINPTSPEEAARYLRNAVF
jgi:UDPglucose--hexose-1-phosphate uridylyltransferase